MLSMFVMIWKTLMITSIFVYAFNSIVNKLRINYICQSFRVMILVMAFNAT